MAAHTTGRRRGKAPATFASGVVLMQRPMPCCVDMQGHSMHAGTDSHHAQTVMSTGIGLDWRSLSGEA